MRKGGNLMQKKLPIGIENFEDMIKENYYYVDKTGLLKQLLNEHGLVNLFTRPRRFGKSLNMSMLKYFFEIGNDQAIFEGLEISKDKELCDQYQGKPQGRTYSLIIPNESIRQIFIEQIQEWFKETTRKDENRLKDFCKAFEEGNAEAIEEQFNNYLMKTISIRDTFTTKKENFYHGVLLGLLSYDPDWYITSNQESGDGYSDIMIEAEQARIGIIIEVKYAENIKTLDKACQKALKQIKEKNYDQKLEEEGYETILNYGIACYKKRCKVLVDK